MLINPPCDVVRSVIVLHFFLGSISIANLAQLFDRGTLRKLKSECGGLQTLLRNHHHVFKGNHDTLCLLLSDSSKKNVKCVLL